MRADPIVGIDVGGSSVKGALVEPHDGSHPSPLRLPTLRNRPPSVLLDQVASMAEKLGGSGPVGVTLPGVVRKGVVTEATNLHPSWAGFEARSELERAMGGRPVVVLNDADAAGLAEVRCGAAAGAGGQTLVLTFGTGIGSVLFQGHVLVQRLELGRLPVGGVTGELHAAARVKNEEGLSWPAWAARVQRFLDVVESVCDPDLLVLGGAISTDYEHWGGLLTLRTATVVPARFRGDAGLVGAALHAHDLLAGS